jgi:hypothetical protein
VIARRATWRREGKPLALVAAAALLATLATFNPYWVPAGDSEVFTVAARNLVRGQGLTYLGEPLAVTPPGWPVVLALLMKLGNGAVWLLKAFTAGCIVMGLVLSYAVLRRAAGVPRSTAAVACVAAAFAAPLYPLSFWLHSDALFFVLATAATLAAATWARSGNATWVVATCVLVVAMTCVRWAGLPFAVVVAAACLGRRGGLLAAVCVVFVAFISFASLHALLSPGGVSLLATVAEEARVPGFLVREQTTVSYARELGMRATQLPSWLSWTLFTPLRFVAYSLGTPGRLADAGVGLLVLALACVAAWRQARVGRWFLVGCLAYVGVLCLAWPSVNSRYLVPVLPVLVAAVVAGVQPLWPKLRRGLLVTFFAAFAVNNVAMWAVDVWVARAGSAAEFYRRYEAGIHLGLLDIAVALRDRPDAHGNLLAVSERYQNLNEVWHYKHPQRVLAHAGGLTPIAADRRVVRPSIPRAQQWAREAGVRFYVHQNPTTPGRVWHFRLTRDQHARIVGHDPGPARPTYQLHAARDHAASPDKEPQTWLVPVEVPPADDATLEELARRVPFLNARPAAASRPVPALPAYHDAFGGRRLHGRDDEPLADRTQPPLILPEVVLPDRR